MDNLKVIFNEAIKDDVIRYAVMVSRYDGKWVYVKHRERDSWEIPGGRLETGEKPWDAACRELYEETGADDFMLIELGNYNVKVGNNSSYGALYFAEIFNFADLPDMEIEQVEFFECPPENQTYQAIQPHLHAHAVSYLDKHISGRLLTEPFGYQMRKGEKLAITYQGENIMIMKDSNAVELIEKLDNATRYEEQLILAKATGNFKRGNEKITKAGR